GISSAAMDAPAMSGKAPAAGKPGTPQRPPPPPIPPERTKPDGAVWDALAWIRASDAPSAEATVIDAAAARRAVAAGEPPGHRRDYAEARRWTLREVGLPEDAVGFVVKLEERTEDHFIKTRLLAAKVRVTLDEVRKAASGHGLVEGVESGAPSWSYAGRGGQF